MVQQQRFTMLKIAVFAPIPSASVSTAIVVNARFFRKRATRKPPILQHRFHERQPRRSRYISLVASTPPSLMSAWSPRFLFAHARPQIISMCIWRLASSFRDELAVHPARCEATRAIAITSP